MESAREDVGGGLLASAKGGGDGWKRGTTAVVRVYCWGRTEEEDEQCEF